MTTELETGLPSTRLVQTFVKEGQRVELKLLTNDVLVGKLRWQDQNCICLQDESNQQTLVWRHAIAYVQPK
ncbi:RNA chaperone Hfq [Coleofasciculus sp. FACHB-64]|jgi:host factor-I protein|uniref:Hfq-related RNA-binding protein n=1 Tax=Cyanophyceae TaxID=3028117 RepID=UPI00168633E9|nr:MULTISPECIES: RNA chaperone Hfq [unclassified Coleofasciculus]MBD1837828.1 RNA chaperone Hfq [Coleofasciculus sp. FACHB-501]MBD1890367.1 RNA chaperone Hfq [Coleofasciculus sp. FACHB-SPT9]MBD1893289.1 RNA chaperone Hfq [Coleofasciculus sp. FACHB-129]MBD1902780.1 RNA chaperone Hfq [Coleofasciculus sp. FACHB-125]MBD1941325.1 RNA chaperone Hfq [Coleofasciculus sp. FACHB-712]